VGQYKSFRFIIVGSSKY